MFSNLFQDWDVFEYVFSTSRTGIVGDQIVLIKTLGEFGCLKLDDRQIS